jgi:Kdo2-lipid IVA lauroyltransferase/acyltransferase
LAQATRARVFVAGAVRDTQGYHVFFEELVAPTQSQTEWLTAMNAVIEAWVRRFPDQYQWEYNRFHQAPDGTHRVI